MKRITGTEGRDDYVLVGESGSMWLAVKPFIMRMPISWSCCVGLRYRGGHKDGVVVTDPTVNGMAWNVNWQKASTSHASASFPQFGMNIINQVSTQEVMDALGGDRMEALVLHVCSQIDPRTRVHDFDADTLKGLFYTILREQANILPPGQDIPQSMVHLPEQEIFNLLAVALNGFLEGGAPEDYPYEEQGLKVVGPSH